VIVEGTPEELKQQLRGDTVQVELVTASAAARPVLERLTGLHDVQVDGPRLRARADSGARAVPAVLAALDEAGLAVASVTVARPTLDDVYLRHVGRAIRDEELAA
jgi:ABC-2 type transport system ATP-binding protein